MKRRPDRSKLVGLEAARRILSEARDQWRSSDPGGRAETPRERNLEGFMEPQAPLPHGA